MKMSRKARPDGRIIRAASPSIRILLATAAVLVLMVINCHQLEAAAAATNAAAIGEHHQKTAAAREHEEDGGGDALVGEKILSRKRRYLIFQEGTSLQLVYDMYFPIVDKGNVGFLGVTAALAYRLPSDPIDLNEAFNQALQGDGLLDRTDLQQQQSNVRIEAADQRNGTDDFVRRPVDSYYNPQNQPNDQSPPPTDRYYTNLQPSANGAQNQPALGNSLGGVVDSSTLQRFYAKPPDRFYENGGQLPGPPQPGVIDQFTNKMDYYFSYADKMLRKFRDMASRKSDPWKNVQWNVGERPADEYYQRVSGGATPSGRTAPFVNRNREAADYNGYTPGNRRQEVHPVLGRRKRAAANATAAAAADDVEHGDESMLTEMDKFHLDLHRSSRLKLYERILRLVDTKQMNGVECVKRALCETRRQRRDTQPDSFLIEMMRAVFTLPKALQRRRRSTAEGDVHDDMHRSFDEAHFNEGDRTDVECAATFAKCAGSVWSEAFRF